MVVVLIVLLAAVGGYFGYKYWARYCRARALLGDWAGANLEYSSLYEDADGRRASVTSLSLSEIKFTSFTSRPHGFSVSYPAEWSVDAARDAQMPIIAQFKCAQSDRTYKSFSIVSHTKYYVVSSFECHSLLLFVILCSNFNARAGHRHCAMFHATFSPLHRRGKMRVGVQCLLKSMLTT